MKKLTPLPNDDLQAAEKALHGFAQKLATAGFLQPSEIKDCTAALTESLFRKMNASRKPLMDGMMQFTTTLDSMKVKSQFRFLYDRRTSAFSVKDMQCTLGAVIKEITLLNGTIPSFAAVGILLKDSMNLQPTGGHRNTDTTMRWFKNMNENEQPRKIKRKK